MVMAIAVLLSSAVGFIAGAFAIGIRWRKSLNERFKDFVSSAVFTIDDRGMFEYNQYKATEVVSERLYVNGEDKGTHLVIHLEESDSEK